MKNKFLSICIPTYNRSQNLSILLNQLSRENLKNVEIIVSDDASPDNGQTRRLVSIYAKSKLPVSYVRNEKNLGYSLNVKKLYEIANGKYVWFLCDDDQIVSGCVSDIVRKLQKHQPVVSIFNCQWVDPLGRKRKAWETGDIVMNKVSELTSYQPIMRTTFLSIDVYQKITQKIDIPEETVKDNIFIQLSLALVLLSKKFSLAQFSNCVVERQVGFNYGEFVKFMLVDHLKAITSVNHTFDNDKFISWSKKMYPTYLLTYLSQKIGLFTYKGEPSEKSITLFKKFYGLPRFYLFQIIKVFYSITPQFVAKGGYFLILSFIHGPRKGKVVFKNMLDRSKTDRRKTLFPTYF